ncbi:MAG: hypothetical protein M1821_007413 [Bathelium mastoideum]|nr:MAG: hypothetical protein M1821_007413 [Bathelium mastoideum]
MTASTAITKGLDIGEDCYIDTEAGADDQTANGSESRPFKSLVHAYVHNMDTPVRRFLIRSPAGDSLDASQNDSSNPPNKTAIWREPSKSAIKKARGALESYKKKLATRSASEKEQQEQQEQRLKRLEEAKGNVPKEDRSLPRAIKVTIGHKNIRLGDDKEKGVRVKVCGRIHRLRVQKQATFVTLVDGYGLLQCVLAAGDLTQSYEAMSFAQGTSIAIYGEMKKVPPGQSAPDGRELHVDFYTVIGHAPTDKESLTNQVSASQNQWDSTMLDNRHLVLRGHHASSLMKIRAAVELAFVQTYAEMQFTKLSPPALVQTQVEGGSTLFKVPYYNQEAYLTQTSQLYLETALPSLGNVYCIEKSFRAEKSLTRRHLSEYTHIEAEMDFIEFADLLEHLEEIICSVIDKILANEEISEYIREFNSEFTKPSRPFSRMRYSEAIDWLNAQDPPILNEFDAPHVFGDDIAEAAERKMTDAINRPIFLTHFPAEIKAFYMKKDSNDPRVTESVDILMPGVGEIVGASMRMEGYEELLDAYQKHRISPKDYYWYTDQRK